jgi:predicted DNA-binding protein YlxM (UPF0122 family)
MPKRRGGNYFVKRVPKLCENCSQYRKSKCENQKLPEYSGRGSYSYRYWCGLSPHPCEKVGRYISQDYKSYREIYASPLPTASGENIPLDNINKHIGGRVTAEQDVYETYYPSSTRSGTPTSDRQGLRQHREFRETQYVGMRYRRPRTEKLPRGLRESLNHPFLSNLQNNIVHLFYFEGLQINEIAHRLSSPGQKITIKVVKREKKKALNKLEEYANEYGIDAIKNMAKERELRADLIKATRLLKRKTALTDEEAEWFRNFTNILDETEWRVLLWKSK